MDKDKALSHLREALGHQPLARSWAKAEILLGLLAVGLGLFLGDWAFHQAGQTPGPWRQPGCCCSCSAATWPWRGIGAISTSRTTNWPPTWRRKSGRSERPLGRREGLDGLHWCWELQRNKDPRAPETRTATAVWRLLGI